MDSLRSWACRLAPRCRIAFAGAAAEEQRPQILVAKTGDEARDAQVREEGAGPRRGGRSGLLNCPADDQIHVAPLAGAARFKAHFDHAVNGVQEWFAGAVHQGDDAEAQRLGQVNPIVADLKVLIVRAEPRPLASAVKPRRPRLAGTRSAVLHPSNKVAAIGREHRGSGVDVILHLFRPGGARGRKARASGVS